MKNAMAMVATLLALTLGARGQTIGERLDALINSNRTVEVVNGFPKQTTTGDWDSAAMQSMTAELLALPKKDLAALPNGIGFLSLRESVSKIEADRTAILDTLEAMHEGSDASPKQKTQIASRLITRSAKVNAAKAKSLLAGMPFENVTASAACAAAQRFGDSKLRDDWFASAKGKGISLIPYRQWFREQIAAITPIDQQLAIQKEIAGLIRNGGELAQVQPWVDELRYRLYVQKELQ